MDLVSATLVNKHGLGSAIKWANEWDSIEFGEESAGLQQVGVNAKDNCRTGRDQYDHQPRRWSDEVGDREQHND